MSGQSLQARIMVVDDDPGLLRLMTLRLESSQYSVETAASAEQALGSMAACQPDAVITDLRMEQMDGMALFRHIRMHCPSIPVIILTAHGTIADAVAATREGAWSFLTKPFDPSELLQTLDEAIGRRAGAASSPPAWQQGIVTRSQSMERLFSELELVAESEASVLVRGESGTGKEVIARAIHTASQRRAGAFVPVNCAAIPGDLLEAELFGHRRGAFTGAEADRPGLFAQADGGTLLLDEIGDMPIGFQPKLLRALQERKLRPIGSDHEIDFDVRVIAASHQNLDQAVAEGRFREDLYYRLNVVQFDIPPLRERPEDVMPLAEHFLHELQANKREPDRLRGLSRDAARLLIGHDWPGNVRQLRNVMEQAIVLTRKGPITAEVIRRALRKDSTALRPLADARDDFERDYLVRVLRASAGKVAEAARLAGRNRTEFYRLLKRHNLNPDAFK